jgi:hypothetical protein
MTKTALVGRSSHWRKSLSIGYAFPGNNGLHAAFPHQRMASNSFGRILTRSFSIGLYCGTQK